MTTAQRKRSRQRKSIVRFSIALTMVPKIDRKSSTKVLILKGAVNGGAVNGFVWKGAFQSSIGGADAQLLLQ